MDNTEAQERIQRLEARVEELESQVASLLRAYRYFAEKQVEEIDPEYKIKKIPSA